MDLWSRGPITTNPYTRTAFRIARVPVEVVRHGTLVRIIGQTRQLIGSRQNAHTIKGEAVTEAELNAAEQVLLDPERRMAEELLAHATEEPHREGLGLLLAQVEAQMNASASAPSGPPNLEGLRCCARMLVEMYLAQAPAGTPFLGGLELQPVPPFGRD